MAVSLVCGRPVILSSSLFPSVSIGLRLEHHTGVSEVAHVPLPPSSIIMLII